MKDVDKQLVCTLRILRGLSCDDSRNLVPNSVNAICKVYEECTECRMAVRLDECSHVELSCLEHGNRRWSAGSLTTS